MDNGVFRNPKASSKNTPVSLLCSTSFGISHGTPTLGRVFWTHVSVFNTSAVIQKGQSWQSTESPTMTERLFAFPIKTMLWPNHMLTTRIKMHSPDGQNGRGSTQGSIRWYAPIVINHWCWWVLSLETGSSCNPCLLKPAKTLRFLRLCYDQGRNHVDTLQTNPLPMYILWSSMAYSPTSYFAF